MFMLIPRCEEPNLPRGIQCSEYPCVKCAVEQEHELQGIDT